MKTLLKHRNKVIGEVKGRTFRKKVAFSKHFCFKHHGWGIQRDTFEEVSEACDEIRILDTENKKVYTTTPSEYLENGIYDSLGDGEQIFLDRKYFNVIEL